MVAALTAGLMAVALAAASAAPATAAPREPDKIVYLTFDDGPDWSNDATLLPLLRRQHVPATFFLVGSRLAQDPGAANRLWLSGNAVGNHSYSHADLTTLDMAGIQQQVMPTQKLLGNAGGRCMRPPYGAVDSAVYTELHNLWLKPVLWNVDPQDWAHQDTGYIVNHILAHVFNRAVVLLHDGGGGRAATVGAVRRLIPELRGRGYEFRTIPACRVPLRGVMEGAAVVPQKRTPKPADPLPTPPPAPDPTPTVPVPEVTP